MTTHTPAPYDEYPVTPTQEGMLFHTLREPGRGVYFERSELRLEGDLDLDAFARAWQQVSDQHAALRTYFGYRDDQRLVQRVRRAHRVVFTALDYRDLDEAAQTQRLEAFLRADLAAEFELTREPPFRVAALRLADEVTHLVISYHHTILDGWSFSLVWSEVFERYDAALRGRTPALPTPRPYADYLDWLAQRAPDDDDAAAFWRQTLAGYEAGAPLSIGGAPQPEARVIRRVHRLDAHTTERLQRFARASRVTFNTLLQAAWAVLVRRYTGRDDVLYGVTTSGRPPTLPGADQMVGLFINTLPLRLEVPAGELLGTWLKTVQRRHAEIMRHTHCALAQIVRCAEMPRDGAIFDSILVFESFPHRDPTRDLARPLRVRPVNSFERTNFPLTLIASPGEALTLVAVADPAVFGARPVARLLRYFAHLLAALPAHAAKPIDRLPGLHPEERDEVTRAWNDTARARPDTPLLHQRFAERAAAHPDRVAIVCGDEAVTYAQANQRANRLAALLRRRGVGPDVLVGVCLERSVDMALAILAVLKAGGAYVPLDPSHPPERLRFLLTDACVPVLLTHRRLRGAIPTAADDPGVLCLDEFGAALADLPDDDPEVTLSGDHLAYVIYTSGSTGQPKGAANRHAALLNRVQWMQDLYRLDDTDRVLQKTPFGFDVSVWEFLWPLAVGARLVFARPDGHKDSAYLVRLIEDQGVTTLHFVPSMLAVFLEEMEPGRCPSLRRVFCSGEALQRSVHDRFFDRLGGVELHNLYGPTEAAIDVTHWACRRDHLGAGVPIGRPIDNTAIYLLDDTLRPVPVGAPGELYIAGANLARGYHRRPALTAERFVPDPFSGHPGARIYRTGDLARFTDDGVIEFIGRVDHQVKLRGFRIELGEIEAVMTEHSGVREAVATVQGEGDRAQLVAYYVGPEVPAEAVRAHLARQLPDYMVPRLVPLSRMPVTANGKLDRRALPALKRPAVAPRATATAAPPSSLERRVTAIWGEVLEHPAPELDTTFFDLGGHSLLLARVHRLLRTRLGVDVPLNDLFQHPTIRALARHLEGLRGDRGDRSDRGDAPPSGAALARRRAAAGRGDGRRDIAIVGMAGRFPGSPDLERFWDNLARGVECVRFFTRDELAAAGVPDAVVDDPDYVPANAFVDDVDQFDAAFFGFTPREAELVDPQQRLLLECAWQAMEDAGYAPRQEPPAAVGMWAGASISTYLLHHLRAPDGAIRGGFRALLYNDKDFLATLVAYKLGLAGPAMTVQTACSTSLVAVHQACASLLAGECAMALAGGVSVNLPQRRGYRHVPGDILSPDGHCRPFDAGAGGTLSGEGVGVVVLKLLDDALRDRDTVRAVIKGTAVNNDGMQKVGFTAPSQAGQAAVIYAAQRQAGVTADSVTYVETHGTGTALGDPIEVAALTQAFRADTDRVGYCALGAVKSNIGHPDAAAGIAGVIKTALMLERQMLVPTLHFESPNPALALDRSPFYVNTTRVPWDSPNGPRRAGVSSFGMGGTNVHAVLEEAPADTPGDPGRTRLLLPLSARTATALERATDALAAHLGQHPELDLADVCATLQRGRRPFAHRKFVVLGAEEDAADLLAERAPGRLRSGVVRGDTPAVVFLFSGQGSQHVGMGRALYEREPVFRGEVDRCARLLRPRLGVDLRDVVYGADADLGARLTGTELAQPALFTIQYAAAMLWQSWGMRPAAMLGHSLGEYTCACLAGVFSLEDALALVAERGRLMAAMAPGAMEAVFASEAELVARLPAEVSLAAVNGDALCVVAGPRAAIERLGRALDADGVGHRALVTSHAFHSAMMEPMLSVFAARVAEVPTQAPTLPYLSNLSGDWVTAEEAQDPDYWVRHVRGTVRFSDAVSKLLIDDARVLLEVGPGTALRNIVSRHPGGRGRVLSTMRAPSERGDDQAVVLEALGALWTRGVEVFWDGLYRHERRRRVPLPTYPFERRRYWIEAATEGGANALTADVADRGNRPALGVANDHSPAAPPVPAEAGGEGAPTSSADPRPELENAFVPPRDPLEALLCRVWEVGFGFDRVGIHDNYFALGGDSILTLQIVAIAADQGVRVTPVDLVEHQTVAALAALPHVQASVREPTASADDAAASRRLDRLAPGTRAALDARWPDIEDVYPLAPMQETIAAELRRVPENARAHITVAAWDLDGPLDTATLAEAWQRVTDRHPALRTVFVLSDDDAVDHQVVLGAHQVAWRIEQCDGAGSQGDAAALAALRADTRDRIADPTAAPPLGLTLICAGPDRHTLLLAYHHLLLDEHAFAQVWIEAFALYGALRAGDDVASISAPSFRHFLAWLDERQGDAADDAARRYWRTQLTGRSFAPPRTPRPGPNTAAHDAPTERVLYPADATARLRAAARGHRLPLGVLAQGVWACLVGSYTGRDEIVHGLKIAGRPAELPGVNDIAGAFANLVPRCQRIAPERPTLDWLRDISAADHTLHEHEQHALPRILGWAGWAADRPLFDTVLALADAADTAPLPELGLRVAGPYRYHRTLVPLRVGLASVADGLSIYATYDDAVFSAALVQHILRDFCAVLDTFTADPQRPVHDLLRAASAPWPRD